MAIVVPILSEFNDSGIKNANKGFKELEGFGKKTAYAIRRAAVPATAAIAGLAAVTFDAVKAAIDDEQAQARLERSLKDTTGATKKQIEEVGKYIDKAGKAFGITDDELRPAMEKLAIATGDVDETMRLTNLAMDIAKSTGKPLEEVASALGRAYNDQYTALYKLDPTLRDVVESGGAADDVFGRLNDKFGGAAQTNAETAAGKFEIFRLRMDELKESIGASLLPIIEELLPWLDKLATWAEENPQYFKVIAGTIAAVAAAIVAVNVAMALNPFVLAAGAISGLALIMVLNWPKIKKWFDDFRAELDATLGPLDEMISLFIEGFGEAFGLGKKLFGTRPFPDPSKNPKVPKMANGGIVKARPGGVLALIGEGGRDEAVVPLSRGSSAFPTGGINITVNAGIGTDGRAVGAQIVDAIRSYERTNGVNWRS